MLWKYIFTKAVIKMLTQTAERKELYEAIDTLPDDSVLMTLNFIKNLHLNDDCDGYGPHIPNAETRAAMAELRAGKGERTTIDQIMAELNAEN